MWCIGHSIYFTTGESSVSTEMRGLFRSSQLRNEESKASSESLLARADTLCKRLRPGKMITNRRKKAKPYSCPSKQFQKNLVVIDYPGDNDEEVTVLCEYHKI